MNRVERQLTRHGEDRKSVLLECAEALLLERGYGDTRMVDVANAAGVTKGLLYWYFDSKESLFREIIEDVRRRARAAMAVAAAPMAKDPLGQLYLGTAEAVRFVADHVAIYNLIWGVQGFVDERTEAARRDASETARVIAAGQRKGQVRSDEPPELLAWLNAGVVTEAVTAVKLGTPVEKAAHAAARYVVCALAGSTKEAERVIRASGVSRRES